ncbi:carboxypeptidase-like regulatory domain-containing protein [Spirosoma aerolatum]|uniref:carboxypeptidase-like regulatory domain-containing protein n=1 Tax=Spirosoma aerolatum TaxID=1211326 RepID=UPI0009AE0235|nr:carboxypeptidase-like regulatory domain-containing protein [Spirosoma aerolatum]
MLRSLLSILLFIVTSSYLYAQTTVRGTITSSQDGSALPGVSVVVKGTSVGTITDKEGKFSVNVPQKSSTLVVSFIGFTTQEVEVANKTNVTISLVEEGRYLNEVMVVGYGTVNKETHVGASSQINANAIANRQNSNALNSVIGAAPGVQATQSGGAPGSAPSIRVRGFGSISTSNEALYVVDGVPYNLSTSNINPDDIESISILKDASTTAIYGSRGPTGL